MNLEKLKLKVKLSSLAAEARIIRKLEKSLRRKALAYNQKYVFDSSKLPVDYSDHVLTLKNHRKHEVALESRATNIALGFLNNRAYEEIENRMYRKSVDKFMVQYNKCHGKPYTETELWQKVFKIAHKYASYNVRNALFKQAVLDGVFTEKVNRVLTVEDFAVMINDWKSKHAMLKAG